MSSEAASDLERRPEINVVRKKSGSAASSCAACNVFKRIGTCALRAMTARFSDCATGSGSFAVPEWAFGLFEPVVLEGTHHRLPRRESSFVSCRRKSRRLPASAEEVSSSCRESDLKHLSLTSSGPNSLFSSQLCFFKLNSLFVLGFAIVQRQNFSIRESDSDG